MFLHKRLSVSNELLNPINFSRESEMENYISENPSILSLEIDGFENVEILKFQQHLKSINLEKPKNGRIDILARFGIDNIAIVELKAGILNKNHLVQLEGYLEKKDQILNFFPDIKKEISNFCWFGLIVGTSINPELAVKLRKGYKFKNIPIAASTLCRYRCNSSTDYVISDTFYKQKQIGRDFSKYLYNGNEYKKGRLALQVIKDYVKQNPGITYWELKEQFPDKLQNRETFTTLKEANNKRDRRNFIEKNEIIKLSDETIAVSTQWGLDNISKFINHCNKLGYAVEKVVT